MKISRVIVFFLYFLKLRAETLVSLLIFHLSKMRDVIINRNEKIMESIKESFLAVCSVQRGFKLSCEWMNIEYIILFLI